MGWPPSSQGVSDEGANDGRICWLGPSYQQGLLGGPQRVIGRPSRWPRRFRHAQKCHVFDYCQTSGEPKTMGQILHEETIPFFVLLSYPPKRGCSTIMLCFDSACRRGSSLK